MKKMKICISSIVSLFLFLLICFSANWIISATGINRSYEDPGGGSSVAQYRTVYDYTPEWGESYFVFYSSAFAYSTYIIQNSASYRTNLLPSVTYSVVRKTHRCRYQAMAPNWTQIDKTVIAYY